MYKKYVEYSDISSAEKLSDTDIFNDTQGSLEIQIDAEPQNAGYYVVVDGVTISDLSAYTMGYGLHTISVYAAAGTIGKYYGLSLTDAAKTDAIATVTETKTYLGIA